MFSDETTNYVGWALWVAAFFLFLPASGFDFVDYDDITILYDVPQVHSGLHLTNILWAFSTLHAGFAYWMPLTWISHQADCQFFGMHPGAHHLTNIILHATNTLLVFKTLQRMTGKHWRSALVALLFAAHPLHVETVAWVAERKSLICTAFWMLTLLAYVAYVSCRNWRRYCFVFVCCACALMGKPMAVTLPISLLLVDFWPLKRFALNNNDCGIPKLNRALIFEKLPLFCITLLGSFLVYMAQNEVGAVQANVRWSFRIQNAFATYLQYTRKLLLPNDLIPIYERHDWPLYVVIAGILFTIAMTGLSLLLQRRYPYFLFGWAWYCVNLLPSSGLVPIGAHAMADRYSYIPLIGIFIILVWGVSDLINAANLTEGNRILFRGTMIVISFTTLALVTGWQLSFWRDGVTLFSRAVCVAPWSPKAHYLLGMNLLKQHSYEFALKEAWEEIRLDPNRAEAFVLAGTALRKMGRFLEARRFYDLALALDPNDISALAGCAYMLSTSGNYDGDDALIAIRFGRRLCELTHNRYAKYEVVLAAAYAAAGQFENAMRTAGEGLVTARNAHDIQSAEALEHQINTFNAEIAKVKPKSPE